MDWKIIMNILLPIVGVMFGYFIKYLLDKRQKNEEILQDRKREQYKSFSSLMINLIHDTKNNTFNANKTVQDLYKIYESFVLFANPNVISVFGDFMQYIYKNSDNMDTKHLFTLRCQMFYEMRQDIGLSNKKLGDNGEKILRPLFNDYESLFK